MNILIGKEGLESQILLADAAQAITNRFNTVFGYSDIRLMCWFHVTQALKKKYNRVSHIEIDLDIHEIHRSQNKEIFEKAINLFKKKHCKETEFLSMFHQLLNQFFHQLLNQLLNL